MRRLMLLPLIFAASVAAAFECGDQDLGVEFYTPRTVRITKTPKGQPAQKPIVTVISKSGDIAVKHEGDMWSTDDLTVRLDRATRTFAFYSPDGKLVLKEKSAATFRSEKRGEVNFVRPRQEYEIDAAVPLYGLGDLQNGKLCVNGIRNRILTPGNVGDGIPYLASGTGWAIWWDNTSPTVFGDDPGKMTFFDSEAGGCVDYYFMYGQSGDGCIGEMRAITGDVPMVPRWAFGYWQSKERYKTPQETVSVVERYRAQGIPMDGIVQDWQYWGENAMWNAMDFIGADWREGEWMIRRAHEMNAKMLITIWQSFGPQTKPYRELAARNLLFPFETWPQSALGHIWPPRKDYPSGVRLCDNFSPITRDIYWTNLKRLWKAGIDGWWMDSTDPDHMIKPGDYEHPTSAGAPFRAVRNAYPLCATKGVYEHQRAETNDKRVFILTRGASAGQQRFATSVWSGDIGSSWDVLRRQIPGGLNYALTGNPHFNSDIGGFFAGRYGSDLAGTKNVNYRELYARWMQFGTFSPMMRSHGTEIPREIYLYGSQGEEIYDSLVNAIQLRYRLMPTIYSLAGHVTKDRLSFMRPVWFDYAADPKTREMANAYLFGTDILVTPILHALYTSENNKPVGEYEGWDKKAESSKTAQKESGINLNNAFKGEKDYSFYLPAGTDWYEFHSNARYAGGETVNMKVTMRSQPFFVKAGGILALGPDVQFNGEKSWETLTIKVYPGKDGRLDFYEDAFEGYGYEKGEWSEIPFVWNDAKETLTIGARKGSFPGMLENRTFKINVIGKGEKTISYAGEALNVAF